MNPLLQTIEFPADEAPTLESLRVELSRIMQNASSISMESDGIATAGLTGRFTTFLSNSFRYFAGQLAKIKPNQHIYVKVSSNEPFMSIPYTDIMNTRIPAVEGTQKSWSVWTDTLELGVKDLNRVVTDLLIPTRDALSVLINRPEKLSNQFVTGLPSWTPTKDREVQAKFAALTDSRVKATDQLCSEAFSRMSEIITTADKLNSLADSLSRSPRTRGSLVDEVTKLVNEIVVLTGTLRSALERMDVQVKPSADIIALLASRLINCAEEIEWLSVVIYRREQFAAAVKDTVDVLRKYKAA